MLVRANEATRMCAMMTDTAPDDQASNTSLQRLDPATGTMARL